MWCLLGYDRYINPTKHYINKKGWDLNPGSRIWLNKICSFDIEASSSHGDFPVPIKSYKKLSTNIIEYFESLKMDMTKELCKNILKRIILAAFGYETMEQIDYGPIK